MIILFQSAPIILAPQDCSLLTTCFYLVLLIFRKMFPYIDQP